MSHVSSSFFCRPTDNKESNDDNSKSTEEEKKQNKAVSTDKLEKEAGAVDFDLALDYEEMDAPHSDNEGEAKEDITAKSIQHSQPKPKDDDNGDSSDDSSGRGITIVH